MRLGMSLKINQVPAALLGAVAPVVNYKTLLVATGDSITQGQAAFPGYADTSGVTYCDLYANKNKTGLLSYENRGVGGSKSYQLFADAAAIDGRIAANPGQDIYCLSVAIGRNDALVNAGGFDDVLSPSYHGGAVWIDQYKAFLAGRRSAGYNKIIVNTITPYHDELEANRLLREEVNDLIRGLVTSGHADGCCDYGNSETSLMGNVSSHTGDTYYQDYVHPTVRGHIELYKIYAPALNAILALATKTATPIILPLSSNDDAAIPVTITCATDGASIYYTRDGSTPDNTKPLYTGPLSVTTETIKAIGIKSGLANSSVNSQSYEVVSGLYWLLSDVPAQVSLSGEQKKLQPISGDNVSWVRTSIKLPSSGKYCIEVIITDKTSPGTAYGGLGMLESARSVGEDCNGAAIPNQFREYLNGSVVASGNASVGFATGIWNGTFTDPQRVVFAIDMDSGKVWHSHDGSTWNMGAITWSDPTTGSGAHWTFTPSANWWFGCVPYGSNANTPSFTLPNAAGVTGAIPSGYTVFNS
jgi:lysophospholipase L1-like esterase